jgi:hypothetical protein
MAPPLERDDFLSLISELESARAVVEELVFLRKEYGDANNHDLTRDAIDLKVAICRVWDELELHVDNFAALAAYEKGEET